MMVLQRECIEVAKRRRAACIYDASLSVVVVLVVDKAGTMATMPSSPPEDRPLTISTAPRAALVSAPADATGGAIARRFAREGYIACGVRRTADKLRHWSRHPRRGGQAHGFAFRTRAEEQLAALFAKI